MIYQGWFSQKLKFLLVGGLSVAFLNTNAYALTTIRNIDTSQKNSVAIALDTALPNSAVQLEFVRDNVQISIKNSSIYPAKMAHIEDAAYYKVFAYQYSPDLVRIRFSVNGEAQALQNQIKWNIEGKTLNIQFPNQGLIKNTPEKQNSEMGLTPEKKESLLAKVLNSAPKAEDTQIERKPEEHKNLGKKNFELQKTSTHEPRSLRKSILTMVLVLFLLGAALLLLRRKNNKQAKKVGQGFFSQVFSGGLKKNKSLIEVVAQHPLGPKQSIVVIRIRGQQFVLGATEGNIQLITQLDSDENEIDVLDQGTVAESIGKFFGAQKVTRAPKGSFHHMIKDSVARAPTIQNTPVQNIPVAREPMQVSVRDQIRRRLEAQA